MIENQELACKFLYFFSRFEFALKATDFLIANGSRVSADWDKFAQSIDKKDKLSEITSDEFQKSVKYFFNEPPRKQIANDSGVLDWEEHKKPTNFFNFKELLTLVRRVRNNFFHGGKFPNGPISGSERNRALIEHSLIILQKCLDLNQEVKDRFQEDGNSLGYEKEVIPAIL